MRIMEWEDEDGRLRRSLVKDGTAVNDVDVAGIPQDPPDIERLDWDAIKIELHNELVRRGLYSIEDVFAQQNGLQAAAAAVLGRRLMLLYKER